jgi:hypothetical protein
MNMKSFARKGVLGLLVLMLAAMPASAAKIGWVTFHPADNMPAAPAATAGFTQAPDIGYTAALTSAGHNVTRFVSHDSPTAADLATLNSFDLIIIGRSVASAHYQQADEALFWNTTLTKPVINMGGYGLRNSRLGLYTGSTIPDTAGTVRLTVNNPSHPIFAGVALDATNTMVNPYANRVMAPYAPNPLQQGISVVTNPIAAGGQVLATIGTAGDPALGGTVIAKFSPGISTAATPSTVLGGHRLIFLSGSREDGGAGEKAGIYDLTDDGRRMFLNAVNFMVAVPEPSAVMLFLAGIAGLGLIRKR